VKWGWGKGDCVIRSCTHSSSNMAIIRDASGLLAICGICRNSLRSIEPEPSLFQMRRGQVITACEYLGQRAAEAAG
jgi:hypothetical protein